MKKAAIILLVVIILNILSPVLGETVVPGYPVTNGQSEDYQMVYLALRTTESISFLNTLENIRLLRAVTSNIDISTKESIAALYSEEGSKVSLVYESVWKDMIRIKIISGERLFTDLIANHKNDKMFFGDKEGFVTLTMNTVSYAIPNDEFISYYKEIYTDKATITFLSPFASDLFEDAEIVLFDYQHTLPINDMI